jgi:hypothetical protein
MLKDQMAKDENGQDSLGETLWFKSYLEVGNG